MGSLLSAELCKYYVRRGNRFIFKNGMTLNQLALEMWEGMGYKAIDSSVLSKVFSGERTFTQKQLDIFGNVLGLSEKEKFTLEEYKLKQIAQRFGISLKHFKNKEGVVGDGCSESMGSNVLRKLKNQYFNSLIEDNGSEEKIVDYSLNKYNLFASGNFNDTLPELYDFETFIKKSKIAKDRLGKNWLMALSALRGVFLAHKLSPLYLYNNLHLPNLEVQKYENVSNNLKPIFYVGWGGMMKLCGEAVVKFEGPSQKALNILRQTLDFNKKGLEYAAKTDVLRVILNAELLANSLEIESEFPEWSVNSMNESSTRICEMAIDESSRLGKRADSVSPHIHEFQARYAIRQATKNPKNSDSILRGALEEIRKAQKIIKRANGAAGLPEINTAVTEVNIYKAARQQVPKMVMQNALKLVISSQDIEQGSRLVDGW